MRSKVIKIERTEEKYDDNIASEYVVIYAEKEGNDRNKIIVNIGNLPPNEELIFIVEFIQFIESKDNILNMNYLKIYRN